MHRSVHARGLRLFVTVTLVGAFAPAAVIAQTSATATAPASAHAGQDVASLVRQILDDERSQADRRAIIEAHPELAVPLLQELLRGMEPGTPEEYRRIPWIWRVTVNAGGRNQTDEMLRIIEISTPLMDAPLLDWQAVVLGGGMIDGVHRVGGWPVERMNELLRGHSRLQERFSRAVELAAAMADDTTVPDPTRYDALRMLPMEPWERSSPQLLRYTEPGVEDELQRGAIQALSDLRSPHVAEALRARIPNFSPRGRQLVAQALIRSDDRVPVLLDALAAGELTETDLGPERAQRLREHPDPAVRERARRILAQ